MFLQSLAVEQTLIRRRHFLQVRVPAWVLPVAVAGFGSGRSIGTQAQQGVIQSNALGGALASADQKATTVRDQAQLGALKIGQGGRSTAMQGLSQAARAQNQEIVAKSQAASSMQDTNMAFAGDLGAGLYTKFNPVKTPELDRLQRQIDELNKPKNSGTRSQRSSVMGVLDKLGDMFNSVSQGPNTGPPSQGFKEGTRAPKDYKPNRIGEEQNRTVSTDAGSMAQETLANISRDELKNYLDKFGSTEEALLADTDSRAMIDNAKSSQVLGQQVSDGMQQRTLSRYGASLTGAQQASQNRMNSLGNASNFTGAVNNSVLAQRDRNLGLKSNLMGIGNEQLGVALGGLSSAAGMEASREAQYQRDRAAAHASNMQMMGQIIGFGIG